jgi:hypothetical protein
MSTCKIFLTWMVAVLLSSCATMLPEKNVNSLIGDVSNDTTYDVRYVHFYTADSSLVVYLRSKDSTVKESAYTEYFDKRYHVKDYDLVHSITIFKFKDSAYVKDLVDEIHFYSDSFQRKYYDPARKCFKPMVEHIASKLNTTRGLRFQQSWFDYGGRSFDAYSKVSARDEDGTDRLYLASCRLDLDGYVKRFRLKPLEK